MAEPIVLPKAGLTMEEGTVTSWLVAVGDAVAAGQPVVEIDTYKATIELEAPVDGILRAALESGQTVPVGTIIGIVGNADESTDHLELGAVLPGAVESGERRSAATETPAPSEAPPAPAAVHPRARDAERSISPAARRRAHELGVDLSVVAGTGPGGRVRAEDVERAAAGGEVA
jgi:pyruvate/2-oxoglutarate dehydrogenase complex dihydrolipoamide acyltransferase (E2) component